MCHRPKSRGSPVLGLCSPVLGQDVTGKRKKNVERRRARVICYGIGIGKGGRQNEENETADAGGTSLGV